MYTQLIGPPDFPLSHFGGRAAASHEICPPPHMEVRHDGVRRTSGWGQRNCDVEDTFTLRGADII